MLAGLTSNVRVKSALTRGTIKNEDSLRETRDLLNRCGIPFTPCNITVHVAGTKGKGGVCAYLERLLRVHGGLHTGLFTSPHLISPRERIRINGRSLDEEQFADILFTVQDRLGSRVAGLNYFRMMLLMGWVAFESALLDVAIIETGIGGRFDSTNVLDAHLCLITSLACEHEDMLGSGIEAIAWHKAGIMKPGVPVLTAIQDPSAMRIIEEQARIVGAPLTTVEPLEGLPWPMNQNAALALAAFKIICPDVTNIRGPDVNELVGTLGDVKWPGRQHIIKSGSTTWYLDGAHTVESIAAALQWLKKQGDLTPTLAFYCGPDKDYRKLLASLGTHWSQAFFVPPVGNETRQIEMARWFAEHTGIHSSASSELPDLCGPIFVTGSLYLVGRVLAELGADLNQI